MLDWCLMLHLETDGHIFYICCDIKYTDNTTKCLIPSRLLSQGIEWTNIEYFNNAIICDLIENVRQHTQLSLLKIRF